MKKNGFTLIELLVVISIISLLSSIVLSSTRSFRDKARITAVKETMSNFSKESLIYIADNGGSYTSVGNNTGICPTSVTSGWGFMGTDKGITFISKLKELSGTTGENAACYISKDSWAINIFVSNLTLQDNSIVKTAHAANTEGSICFDSSGNRIIDNLGSGSDGESRFVKIKEPTPGKYVCY